MLQFIETICYENGGFQRITLHEERMNRTRIHFFGTTDRLSLENALTCYLAGFPPLSGFQSTNFQATNQKLKCRVTYSQTIENIEFESYMPKVIQSLQLVYDDIIEYCYKYKDRSALNALLGKRGSADEILIVKNGLITDTSYSNVVFLRDGKWYTPETPLLPGTRRAFYLQDRLIFPLNIKPEEIGQFEEVRLINSMLSLEEALPIKTDCIF
ncbi:MAG TPA: aminotransferase class IV [Prolixibacteraceae bacterium]|nr:aminotransferase class IV [Prolixibacteraceae bacterium]